MSIYKINKFCLLILNELINTKFFYVLVYYLVHVNFLLFSQNPIKCLNLCAIYLLYRKNNPSNYNEWNFFFFRKTNFKIIIIYTD